MQPSYTAFYEQSDQQIHGVVLNQAMADALAGRFVNTFNHIGQPDFMQLTRDLFADDLYANDTLSIYHHYSDMIEHFQGMNQSVTHSHVELKHVFIADDSAYVNWKMDYTLKVLGREKAMSSFGISQIKMNAQGKIIFQQDYWDSNNGLYHQLPIVGGLYRWLSPIKQAQ
ncbi:MAG: nuclear transport factor 2 family protein [Gammaproteobacteria bacterium]|nr:nuclear transport factor 2 family protein [Gammaproteobacteria bacterium]